VRKQGKAGGLAAQAGSEAECLSGGSRSALYYVDLTGGQCELLSDDSLAVSSPRLSPDQCRIVYLRYPSLVPHHQCSQLCLYDWYTKVTSVVVDVVPRQLGENFSGIYCSLLPLGCWSADSQRVVFDSAQRSRQDLFVVDTQMGSVSSLTAAFTASRKDPDHAGPSQPTDCLPCSTLLCTSWPCFSNLQNSLLPRSARVILPRPPKPQAEATLLSQGP